jgi:hypothetical protein
MLATKRNMSSNNFNENVAYAAESKPNQALSRDEWRKVNKTSSAKYYLLITCAVQAC